MAWPGNYFKKRKGAQESVNFDETPRPLFVGLSVEFAVAQSKRKRGGPLTTRLDGNVALFVARIVKSVHHVENVISEALVASVVAPALYRQNHVRHADTARVFEIRVGDWHRLRFLFESVQHDFAAKIVGMRHRQRAFCSADLQRGQRVRLDVERHDERGDGAGAELHRAGNVSWNLDVHHRSSERLTGNGSLRKRDA